jgi:hypothetical protein
MATNTYSTQEDPDVSVNTANIQARFGGCALPLMLGVQVFN